MTTSAVAKRATCPRCLRALRACICRWITPLAPQADVLILQHPLEVRAAKGSARLLHLCLPGSRLVVGDIFDAGLLRHLLYGAGDVMQPMLPDAQDALNCAHAAPGRQPLLLYPAAPGQRPPVVPATAAKTLPPAQVRLVVLDATWRKSRAMLQANPLLQALPRLALSAPPPSRYRIRKAHRPEQLSTFEATCHALEQLEGEPGRYHALLAAFDGFVAQQVAFGMLASA